MCADISLISPSDEVNEMASLVMLGKLRRREKKKRFASFSKL